MDLLLRLGKGNAGSVDELRSAVDEAERIRNERLDALRIIAENNLDVLAKLGLKIGDVLIEKTRGCRKLDRATRYRVVGTRLNEFNNAVKVLAVNTRKDGSLGERFLSEYADVELESSESPHDE